MREKSSEGDNERGNNERETTSENEDERMNEGEQLKQTVEGRGGERSSERDNE